MRRHSGAGIIRNEIVPACLALEENVCHVLAYWDDTVPSPNDNPFPNGAPHPGRHQPASGSSPSCKATDPFAAVRDPVNGLFGLPKKVLTFRTLP
jgi:hypothetical protein